VDEDEDDVRAGKKKEKMTVYAEVRLKK